ncbi:hypothetical protein OAB00_04115, partial [Akkermansiaceae bacterium]|nr:hypothetical protein [Akkermansiaceae bacterium]
MSFLNTFIVSFEPIGLSFESGKAGICIIKVETEKFESTTLVQRSDIDIALRSSKSELIAYAKDSLNNTPAKNIRFLIASGEKIIAEGKTDSNGIFLQKVEELKNLDQYRVLAMSDRGAAVCSQQTASLFSVDSIKPKAWFQTDRSEIRAGDMVTLSGVVREAQEGEYIYPKQRDYKLVIRMGNTTLMEKKVNLTAEGGFSEPFRVPKNTKTNSITCTLISTDEKQQFNYSTSLAQFSELKGKVELEIENPIVKAGDIIKGNITATYRWGAPYAHKKVSIRLPIGQDLVLITDENGKAEFSYDTSGVSAGMSLNFSSYVTSLPMQGDQELVAIDPINLRLKVE